MLRWWRSDNFHSCLTAMVRYLVFRQLSSWPFSPSMCPSPRPLSPLSAPRKNASQPRHPVLPSVEASRQSARAAQCHVTALTRYRSPACVTITRLTSAVLGRTQLTRLDLGNRTRVPRDCTLSASAGASSRFLGYVKGFCPGFGRGNSECFTCEKCEVLARILPVRVPGESQPLAEMPAAINVMTTLTRF